MSDELTDEMMGFIDTHEGSGCWLWSGTLRDGRPVIVRGGKKFNIRRYLYEKNIGPLLDFYTSNKCGNNLCVNPDHTEMSNYADASVSKRKREPKTKCRFGHDIDGLDIKRGNRFCKKCKAIAATKPEYVKKRAEYAEANEAKLKEYRRDYYKRKKGLKE